jgi:uncharacterized RDD family membrane protein YckC
MLALQSRVAVGMLATKIGLVRVWGGNKSWDVIRVRRSGIWTTIKGELSDVGYLYR